MIKILIVDDEEFGRLRVQQLLADNKDIEIVGICESGESAVHWLDDHHCDLVFLDIQMPEINGFDVIRQTAKDKLPLVVFITAYHEYAIEAFRVHALDYLLKPVDRDLFQQSLKRAMETLRLHQQSLHQQHPQQQQQSQNQQQPQSQQQAYIDRLTNMIQEQNQQTKFKQSKFKQKFVTIKQGERIFPVQYTEIIAIEAQANYLSIHTEDSDYRMRSTLTQFLEGCGHQPIQQINRSVAINIEHIQEIQRYFKGEYAIIMKNGLQFTTSNKHRCNIQALLE